MREHFLIYRLRRQTFWPLYLFFTTLLLPIAAGAATRHFHTDNGSLSVEVNDETAKISLDGEELRIKGTGSEEVRLGVGKYLLGANPPGDVLTISLDGRVVVRVRTEGTEKALNTDGKRDELLRDVHETAGQLVTLRSDLDNRVWKDVSSRWTTTEAAKLLIAFFRGDGTLPGFNGTPAESEDLRRDLGTLRKEREHAFASLTAVARIDSKRPKSPLCGTWKVIEVQGAGGIAADALELYNPDPIARKFVATNNTAGLLTGAGFWLFDATYDGNDGVDLSAVVRGGTVYHGRFHVERDDATLRVSPMNAPRPTVPDGEPTDGGFVLHLRRINTP